MTASSSVSSSSMSGRSSSGPRSARRVAGEPAARCGARCRSRSSRRARRRSAAGPAAAPRESGRRNARRNASGSPSWRSTTPPASSTSTCVPCDADAHLRRQADERIAAEALAADDRFEQERVALVRELQIERQRRVEIGERLEHERDAVVALRGERAELGFGDHGPPRLRLTPLRCPRGGAVAACERPCAASRTRAVPGTAQLPCAADALGSAHRGDRRP